MEATGECRKHRVLYKSEGRKSVPGKCWFCLHCKNWILECAFSVTAESAAGGGGMVMVVDSKWVLVLLLLGYKLEDTHVAPLHLSLLFCPDTVNFLFLDMLSSFE
jgi:hypothetical protein